MKPLPKTNFALVLRTDFTDDEGWEAVCNAISEPVGDFRAYVEFISDLAYDGITIHQILSTNIPRTDHWFLFIVDHEAITNNEHPILVLSLGTEPGRTFRAPPSEMWGIENNLTIANMDFAEFADNVDPDGVFRGFAT